MARVCPYLLLSVLIVGALAGATRADVPDEAREGAEFYRDSAFAAAADAFRQATIAAPEDPRWRYDLGLSEAQGQDYENALNNLQGTAGLADSNLAGAAWYNAGNVHLAMGNNAEAARAYRETLLRDPNDAEAKHNLELALKRLAQQQQQRQEQKQDSQEGDQEKQDQDEQQKSDEKQDQKQNQDQQDPQDQNQSQEPQEQPESQPQADSTLTREQAERILRALADEEAKLRDQARKIQAMPAPAGKDW
jgi:tetratricopeptide (TPR) repeat protein